MTIGNNNTLKTLNRYFIMWITTIGNNAWITLNVTLSCTSSFNFEQNCLPWGFTLHHYKYVHGISTDLASILPSKYYSIF